MFGRLEGTLPTPPVARRQRSPTLPTTEATMRCVRQASVGAALAQAEQHAAGASDAERLQIQMARKGFDNDLVGQLALGRQLVEKYPDSPRAWLALAGVQGALNYNAEARTSIAKALELAPRLFA